MKQQTNKNQQNKYRNEIKMLREQLRLLGSQNDYTRIAEDNINYLQFYNMALRCFEYVDKDNKKPIDLPMVNSRIIEKGLFTKGAMCIFKHAGILLCLPFVYEGGITDNNEYAYARPISLNGINYGTLKIDEDCVIIRDNNLEIAPIIYARFYAKETQETQAMIRKNRNYLGLPFIIDSTGDRAQDDKNALEVKQILTADRNTIAVVSSAMKQLTLLDLKPQYVGRELMELTRDYKNMYYEFLGVNNIPFEKNERLTDEEAVVNQEANNLNSDVRLKPRKEAIDKANKLFGLNIDIEQAWKEREQVKTTNVVASVAGGSHNNRASNQQGGRDS